MSAKQSALLVARARKRRRDREELRARCGVFNDDPRDRNAPDGWVEIQRNDTIDREFGNRTVEVFADDEEAALAVAALGGAPGTAMHYETGSGLFEPCALDGCGVSEARWIALRWAARAIDPETRHLGDSAASTQHWICIVPRAIAKAAGLDCEDA